MAATDAPLVMEVNISRKMSKQQHQDNERQLPDEPISGTLGAKPSSSHGEDVVTIER